MAKKIGVLGSGDVAKTLAAGFLKNNYDVMVGSGHPDKLQEWKLKNPAAKTGSFQDAAKFGDIVVLAVKGNKAEEILKSIDVNGKTVIDTTNPIDDKPPVNGVIHYFTKMDESLMERLQKAAPKANFVKAFNSVGNAFMVNPSFKEGKPSMFICGNDDEAKKEVVGILDQFGWNAEDMGKVESARAIEPLCILWCLPGFIRNDWAHAFKVVR